MAETKVTSGATSHSAISSEPTSGGQSTGMSPIQSRESNAQTEHSSVSSISSISSDPEEQTIEARQKGRAAVISYDIKANAKLNVEHWDLAKHDIKATEAKFKESTRLVILEDVGAEWTKVLARLLKLPKRLFVLHAKDPEDHILGDAHIPLGEDPKQHFVLHYIQPLPFEMKHPGHEEVDLVCNAKRKIIHRISALRALQTEKNERAEQLVSYYTGRLDKREIAVLLVDPCPSDQDQFPDGHGADPLNLLPHVDLSNMNSQWDDWTKEDENNQKSDEQPANSMYDELIQYFKSLQNDHVNDLKEAAPYEWASRCCSIVLARNASTVQSSYVETWKLTYKASTGVRNLVNFDYDKVENKAWSDDWKGEFFSQLWELREELELMQYKLQTNKQVFSRLAASQRRENKVHFVNNTEQSTQHINFFGISDREAYPKVSFSLHKTGEMGKMKEGVRVVINNESTLERELEEWDRIIKLNSYSIQLMDRTTETYVQAIGATQAQFANEQTKNSKKLTGFAAVFVPASLCAAILAIPSFSPDSPSLTKFIAFWGVSVPLAFVCAIMFLTELPHWLKNKWKDAFYRPTEEDVEKAAETAPTGEDIFRRPRRQALPRTTTVTSGRDLPL